MFVNGIYFVQKSNERKFPFFIAKYPMSHAMCWAGGGTTRTGMGEFFTQNSDVLPRRNLPNEEISEIFLSPDRKKGVFQNTNRKKKRKKEMEEIENKSK